MHSGTAGFTAGAYAWSMQLLSIKAVLAMLWVSAVSIAGIAANVESVSGWTILAVVAAVPPLVMIRGWNDPGPTMSQTIQQARR